MANELRDKLLDAALPHVVFDGWGETSLLAGARDAGIEAEAARVVFAGGATDLAAAYHQKGDDAMLAQMASADLGARRYSERVAAAVWFRLEVAGDKELVRREMTLFALPQNAAEGARLIWGTADRIWCALGDTSDDINWYSKRAILSGVYASCVLYWLGDTSQGHSASREFVNRRIGDVMRFEKFKARARDSSVLAPLLSIGNAMFAGIKAPSNSVRADMPGHRAGPP